MNLSGLLQPPNTVRSIYDLEKFKASPTPRGYPINMRTFWAPHDDVHGVLTALFKSAQHSIVLSMYGWNDADIAQLVAHAIDDPNMLVQITLDKSQAGGVHERELLDLYKAEMESNSVAIGTSERGAILHRKVIIIDGLWRISGSTNLGDSAEIKQANELTVIQDATVCAEARHMLDLAHVKALTQMGVWNARP